MRLSVSNKYREVYIPTQPTSVRMLAT